ncbi:Ist1-like protein [Thalictrum thalictroides]|uniref:Ist1-like protein n=1 Tax=Thalictrum thalictroides TaxID=46969 RepID=A0A7J6V5L9_THATH|nr:Ist1-like protein [Thalictrum thalictroides]
MDALLRRNFKTSKFKSLVNLAISRLAVLKNQRQVRCSQARSDTSQLLNLGHQERALLRVELVIKEQNMLDAFLMMERYCHELIERVILIENNKECPDELKEAISSLIFAASRCGDFPELQEIRSVFASRFGKDFVSRAAELRNNCGVNPKILQKLSTRHPSSESRMKVLQEIATENGVTLQLQEEVSQTTKDNLDSTQKQNQPKIDASSNINDAKDGDQTDKLIKKMDQVEQDEENSGSLRRRTRYSDVASAAQAAFESAAYAAAAARAAVELSRSDSPDNYPNNHSSPASQKQNKSGDDDGSSRSRQSRLGNHVVGATFGEFEHSTDGLGFENIHSAENSSSDSESEELQQNHDKFQPEDFSGRTHTQNLERSLSASSSYSAGNAMEETKISSPGLVESKLPGNVVFDESDDDIGNEYTAIPWSNVYGLSVDEKSRLSIQSSPKTIQNNTISKSGEGVRLKRLNIERRPVSVRTRQGNGR